MATGVIPGGGGASELSPGAGAGGVADGVASGGGGASELSAGAGPGGLTMAPVYTTHEGIFPKQTHIGNLRSICPNSIG